MNQLIVEFHGICVHFNRENNPDLNLPTAHRIVLPFLPDGLIWEGNKVLVHEPTVSVTSPDLVTSFAPLSMTLTLSTLTRKSEITSTFQCPPGLKKILPEMVVDKGVVVDRKAPAATYFDISEGTLSGIDIEGSAGIRLTIETELTEVALTKTLWEGTPEPTTLKLPATIIVSNLAKDPASDLTADFIIAFAIGTPFPPPATSTFLDALEKALEGAMVCLKSTSQDIGPGCSNSQFP